MIIHSVDQWLPASTHWIYDQYEILGKQFEQIIIADGEMKPHPEVEKLYLQPELKMSLNNRLRQFVGFPTHSKFRTNIHRQNAQKHRILFSHFGSRGFRDLPCKAEVRIVRFYGFDLMKLIHDDPKWQNRYNQLFKKTDLFVVEGYFMKDSLQKIGAPKEKIHVLPLGVEKAEFVKWREVNESTCHLLIAGTFREKKGILYSLKAAELLLMKGFKVQIHLVGDNLLNDVNDLLYADQIDKLIEEKLSNCTTRYGFVDRLTLRNVAKGCHIGIFASIWTDSLDCEGGYPLSMLEVMAEGLPIVATRHCDLPMVVNSENGMLVDERNADQIAGAIMELFTKENLGRASANASDTIRNSFTWDVLAPQYLQFFKAL